MPDGQRRPLIGTSLRLGRDPSSDLVLPDDSRVSRSHAELTKTSGQWSLLDLGSSNGTTVNGRRISRHPLRDGDRIQLGRTTLIYVAGNDSKATEIGTDVSGKRPDLTERERQILLLISQGLTDREIGDRLFISASTVRSHLDRIAEKTGQRRRAELTRLALELGIVS